LGWQHDNELSSARYQRIVTAPKGSLFLFGVRGAGKSSWTREAFPGAFVVDRLDAARYQTLRANPGQRALELRALPRGRVVVLDEVQRVPAMLNEVHRSIEEERRRFVMLGS